MIDLKSLRQMIEAGAGEAPDAPIGTVSRRWLEEVELQLTTGNAALIELAAIRRADQVAA